MFKEVHKINKIFWKALQQLPKIHLKFSNK